MENFNLNALVRENIKSLSHYSGLREEYFDKNAKFLDANESPFGTWNRYPDSFHCDLKKRIAEIKNLESDRIFLGNGSEDLIDLIIRIFCEPKKDSIIVMDPTYSMYEYYAVLNEVKVEKLQLDENFDIRRDDFDELNAQNAKIIFLCSPNNPTGNCVKNIEYFIKNFKGLVVVDEAYHLYSSENSAIDLLDKYSNLIILRTLSKAFGMAGLRIGIGISSSDIAQLISKVKPPYSISNASKQKALQELLNLEAIKEKIQQVLVSRNHLRENLIKIDCVKKVHHTEANFLLVEFHNAEKVYQNLLTENIVTSLKHPEIQNCIRINVGTEEDNENLISHLRLQK
ncbi:MAG: histidinol-phosphate transaminase [Kaistella sp.]|nr:histidinol-phosphate transaminase [Kaistella sp.]